MNWTQVYDPLNSWPLSTLVAAIPIAVLFYLLAVRGTKPHWAAMISAITATLLASAVFTMPLEMSAMSFAFGAALGISCAFMIGLGFDPFYAAVLNLIANTAPVAWGSIGTSFHTLAAATGLNESDLSAMAGRILPFTSIIVPIWLVRVMAPWRATLEVMPAILVCGVSFALTQFVWSNYVDSNLVDIASAAACIASMLVFLRFWQPKNVWRFAKDEAATTHNNNYTRAQIAKAWAPFVILTVFVLLWGLPSIKNTLNRATTPSFAVTLPDGKPRPGPPGWDVPMLHNRV